MGGDHHQRPGSGSGNINNAGVGGEVDVGVGGGEISWGDIGNGGVNDPAVSVAHLNNLKIGGGSGGGEGVCNVRAEKLLASDVKERRLLDYVTGRGSSVHSLGECSSLDNLFFNLFKTVRLY